MVAPVRRPVRSPLVLGSCRALAGSSARASLLRVPRSASRFRSLSPASWSSSRASSRCSGRRRLRSPDACCRRVASSPRMSSPAAPPGELVAFQVELVLSSFAGGVLVARRCVRSVAGRRGASLSCLLVQRCGAPARGAIWRAPVRLWVPVGTRRACLEAWSRPCRPTWLRAVCPAVAGLFQGAGWRLRSCFAAPSAARCCRVVLLYAWSQHALCSTPFRSCLRCTRRCLQGVCTRSRFDVVAGAAGRSCGSSPLYRRPCSRRRRRESVVGVVRRPLGVIRDSGGSRVPSLRDGAGPRRYWVRRRCGFSPRRVGPSGLTACVLVALRPRGAASGPASGPPCAALRTTGSWLLDVVPNVSADVSLRAPGVVFGTWLCAAEYGSLPFSRCLSEPPLRRSRAQRSDCACGCIPTLSHATARPPRRLIAVGSRTALRHTRMCLLLDANALDEVFCRAHRCACWLTVYGPRVPLLVCRLVERVLLDAVRIQGGS